MNDEDVCRLMMRSRLFEEKLQGLFDEGVLYGTTHLNIGQEASHTGLCLALEDDDWIVPTHRCHGFNIASGSDLAAMFSELLGSSRGLCKGLGGSMHMTDVEHHNFGSSAIVGSSVALAMGIAFALSRQGRPGIAVAIMGDGATSRGVVHECMNLASVWSLPLMFYCENNHYGMSASAARMISTPDISSRAAGYSMKSFKADGNDYQAVHDTVRRARSWIVEHDEPVFVEVDTYRLCGHSKSDRLAYRGQEEEAAWKAKDPVSRLYSKLSYSKTEVRRLRQEEEAKVDEAWKQAWEHRDEILPPEALDAYVYAPSPAVPVRRSGLHPASYRDAIREALADILASDPRATLIGEDVGLYGGCFSVTKGLWEHFPGQVLETPVSEEGFIGMAVGAAAMGEHPVVEIMYGDFATLASDPLVNHAAKLRYMSAGQLDCPMVLRAPMGSGTGHGSQHTQSLETMFLGIPGLKIVCPSDPFTAKALLKAAAADPGPVLFCEHKALYSTMGECGDALSSFPIGKAQLLCEGDEVTLVSYSRATLTCRRALADVKRPVEHIDLCTIQPLDWQAVRTSVLKTGRLVIVQDTPLAGSVGASIAALAASDEAIMSSLKAPVRIVSGKDWPTPFSRDLEEILCPQVDEVASLVSSI